MKARGRYQLNFSAFNDLCTCCLQQWDLPSFVENNRSIVLQTAWVVLGFPWNPFGEATFLKKSIGLQLRFGFYAHLPSPCWDSVWLRLAQVLCMLSQSWVLMCSHSAVPWGHCLLIFNNSSGYLPFHHLLQWSLSFGRRGCKIHVPFRTEHSVVFYFLHLGWLWFSVFPTTVYYK